jgi:hypothetical protein
MIEIIPCLHFRDTLGRPRWFAPAGNKRSDKEFVISHRRWNRHDAMKPFSGRHEIILKPNIAYAR